MQLIQVLSDVQLVAFGSLAVVSLLEWRRRRGEAAGWVALTLGTVGAILVIGKLLPKDATAAPTRLQWTVLALAVAVGLWRAGAGEPTIARRRMRILASGSAGLALIIVIAGATPGGRQFALTIVTQLMGLGAASLFYLGFAPPTLLRQAWRQHEDEALRGAVARS